MALTKPRAYQIFDLDYKQSTRVITVANITLGGGAPSQVDGVTLSLNDRVLVTGQSTGSQNGLYYVTTVGSGSNGTWARSQDGNQTGEIEAGMIIMVTEGNTYADTQWKLTTNDPIVIGTTTLTFVQNYSANSITSGTSNVVVANNSNVSIAVAGSNIVVFSSGTQNIAGNIIPTANVTYDLGNATNRFNDLYLANNSIFLGNVTLAATSTGLTVNGSTVVTSSDSSTLSLTGNITGGNINGVGGTFSGNVVFGNIFVGGYYYANGVVFSGGGGGTPGGANTQIQFNDNGVFGGSAGLTFNKTTNAVATTGTFSATGAVTGAAITGTSLTVSTGNITGGNLLLSGAIVDSAQLDIQTSASNANIALAPNGTGVVTVSTQLVATGNVTGGNIRTAGLISATGAITGASVVGGVMTGSSLSVTGTINGTTLTGTSLTVSTGNITVGNLIISGTIVDSSQLDIQTSAGNANIVLTPNGTGVIVVAKDIRNGQATGVGNIGAAGATFNTIFAKATSAQYADLAEIYVADSDYTPGTVVEFGGEYEITISSESHSTTVAGIVSTNPSYLMNSTQTGKYVLPIALTGRVPCQVQGPVRKGDVLVASSTPGVAQRIGMNWQPGCVLGKSMEVIDSAEIKTIEVAVGRF